MKVKVSYLVEAENWFDVPKEFEFFFTKDEEDWTDDEWDITENGIVSQILMRNNIDFEDWMKLDCRYVDERNLIVDIKFSIFSIGS